MMNEMMSRMMNNCCGGEGKPDFEKIKKQMENCCCFSGETDDCNSTEKERETKAGTESCGGGEAASTERQNR